MSVSDDDASDDDNDDDDSDDEDLPPPELQGNRVNHYGKTLLPPKRVTNTPGEFDLLEDISSSSIAIPTNVIHGQQATLKNVHCFGRLFEFHKNKR